MELLQAVNTVLPYLNAHVITRIETTKHPTVDLILAAIERQRITLLTNGWWFNEMDLTIPVNTDGQIDVPKDTVTVIGLDCKVAIDGEKFYDLENATRYFTKPIKVRIYRDLPFNRLPPVGALAITYLAGIEVYTADLGAEDSLQIMQSFATTNMQLLRQENLRNRRYNANYNARQRSSYSWLRFR